MVLFDPPYSARQAAEVYKLHGDDNLEVHVSNNKYWSLCKDEVARITRVGGCVLSFGWNSNGIGKNRWFEIERVLLVAHGGCHNDTICVCETKSVEQISMTEDWCDN